MNTEHRKMARLLPKSLTFVAVRPEFAKLGRLIDITMEGLCFQYVVHEEGMDDMTSFKVDIFVENNGFYLQNLPCKLVYDTANEREITFSSSIVYRRCGLQFREVSREHSDQLETYLRDYTAGTAD